MRTKKEELGKGIRSLLQDIDTDVIAAKKNLEVSSAINVVNSIPLDQIEVNPFQPRADFEEQSLAELAESIKVHGIIQPITVRKLKHTKYQLIAGERRLRASKIAGLKDIPAYTRAANDQEVLEIALIENIQRENLNAIEIAINYKRLIKECSLTQDGLAERIAKDRTTVTNYLRLLRLPPDIQLGIKGKMISMGHARALIALQDPEEQLSIYNEIIKKDLSVRKVEALVRSLAKGNGNAPAKTLPNPQEFKLIQDNLGNTLGAKVRLKRSSGGKGEIIISFSSDEDLNRLLSLIDKR